MAGHEGGCLLMVGGSFNDVDGTSVSNIFLTRDGTTVQAMEGGVNGEVTYIEQLDRRTFLIGGYFTEAGGQAASGFASVTIGEDDYVSWGMYGSGVVDGAVYDARPMSNNWLLVGDFTSAGGNLGYTRRVAEFNVVDQNYRALGTGAVLDYPVGDGIVKAGAGLGGDYYFGGDFTAVEGASVYGLAMSGMDDSFDSLGTAAGTDVRGMAESLTDVFMVGNFAGVTATCGIVAYNPTDGFTDYDCSAAWANGDPNGILRLDDGTMYVYGDMGEIAELTYDGTAFSAGTGFAGASGNVVAFAVNPTESIGTELNDGDCNFGQGPGPGAASLFAPSLALTLLVMSFVGALASYH